METTAQPSAAGSGAESAKPSIGLIGLAVMGENLALNIANKGFPISVYNRTGEKTRELAEGRAQGKTLYPTYTIEEFVQSMARPRKIIILVKAGAPVDAVIQQLKPVLEPDDIIIDGGNSLFTDTEKRFGELEPLGLRFMGMGVSGGEEGALLGPSLMPGGPKPGYDELAPILTRVAAQTDDDGACVTYIGPRGAGHYVKMVHNGIEYGDMQLIAEAYDLLRQTLGLGHTELHEIFAEWNESELKSFLIEITAQIFTKLDPDTGKPLVDLILDKAGQKGTGKWTSQNAYDLGVPIPTINAAVESRILSSFKTERVAAAKIFTGPQGKFTGDKQQFIDAVKDALYCAKICSYAQGYALLRAASKEYDYAINLSETARIWKAGCIIRAIFLDRIKRAFLREADLTNLLVDAEFSGELQAREANWRYVVQTAAQLGIPAYATSASLAYFDAYRTASLPLNLTQAQRDFFGAHTYERIDKAGIFHTEWAH